MAEGSRRSSASAGVIVGVDVGGTNTDAAVLRDRSVLACFKTATTKDLTECVAAAVRGALSLARVELSEVCAVSVGTTAFVNAVVQRSRQLGRVAVLRLCQSANHPPVALPPFHGGFPADLRALIAGHDALLQGGLEYDGQPTGTICKEEVARECALIQSKGIRDVVICGAFSPLSSHQEDEVAAMVRALLPDARITLSHRIGRFGLLEREHAAVLNASLRELADTVIPSFVTAFAGLGLRHARLFLTQNDGTLMPADDAMEFPVLTFASGPTNSIRGAAFLAQVHDAVVIDVGGTTADIGVLRSGFPLPSAVAVEVGGVRTNFRMPQVLSLPIGGGTLVRLSPHSPTVSVGPQSVGFELDRRALVFGGADLTLTDVAVGLGRAAIGDPARVKHVTAADLQAVAAVVQQHLMDGIDLMRGMQKDEPLILVGGGSVCVGEQFPGFKVVRPAHYDAANAVGAAIAQVSGSVDRLYSLAERTREEAIRLAVGEAQARALSLGASEATLQTVHQEDSKPAYDTQSVLRVIVRVVGDLDLQKLRSAPASTPAATCAPTHGTRLANATAAAPPAVAAVPTAVAPPPHQKHTEASGCVLSPEDLECIALGAGLLGSGGGGSTFIVHNALQHLLAANRCVKVIQVDALADDDLVVAVALMGAPTVAVEKLPRGNEVLSAVRGIEAHLGRRAVALLCGEVGGCNALTPLLAACIDPTWNVPVLDADGMGRAFPELQMFAPFIYGAAAAPAALADEKGNCVVMSSVASPKWLESILRTVVTTMGCSGALALCPLRGAQLKQQRPVVVKNSISLAWRLGAHITEARRARINPIRALERDPGQLGCSPVRVLVESGKIADVKRVTEGGFARGRILIALPQQAASSNLVCEIEFQNEFLVASLLPADEAHAPRLKDAPLRGRVLAIVPDLVVVVDADTAEPIACEDLRFGLRVAVLALPCDPIMRTPEALRVVGPAAFGFRSSAELPSLASTWVTTVPMPAGRP